METPPRHKAHQQINRIDNGKMFAHFRHHIRAGGWRNHACKFGSRKIGLRMWTRALAYKDSGSREPPTLEKPSPVISRETC